MTMPPRNPFSLEGRRALVTGASRGLGQAIAVGLAEAGADRTLRTSQASGDPLMLVDRVGQLAVLVLGHQRVVDDRAVGALLVELVRGFAKVGRVPETGANLLALVDDLLLLHQLRQSLAVLANCQFDLK